MKTTIKHILGGLILAFLVLGCSGEDEDVLDPGRSRDKIKTVDVKPNYTGVLNSYSGTVLRQWNDLLAKTVDNKMPPPAEGRIYAMVTLAMHDALNNIIPIYQTYALPNDNVSGKDVNSSRIRPLANAAVSQAAYEVLVATFPPAQQEAEALLSEIMARISDIESRDEGIEVGRKAAQAMLTKRQSDAPITFSSFDMGTAPGVHQSNYLPFVNPGPAWPAKAVYGADLGTYMPFGIASSDQFRARPPYAVNSPEFAADFNEVKTLGCAVCPDRTEEQSEIGLFWIENLASLANRMAFDLAGQKKLNAWETARLSALTTMTVMDTYISSFEGKYHYNFWRPVTAIRAGEFDGNDQTVGDPGWVNNERMTPPTPDYPSTHAEAGGAVEELFRTFFKKDEISLDVISPYYMPGTTRTIKSFSQMGEEIALSRIYIGYHFRNAVEQGRLEGQKLAAYVFSNNLSELNK